MGHESHPEEMVAFASFLEATFLGNSEKSNSSEL